MGIQRKLEKTPPGAKKEVREKETWRERGFMLELPYEPRRLIRPIY